MDVSCKEESNYNVNWNLIRSADLKNVVFTKQTRSKEILQSWSITRTVKPCSHWASSLTLFDQFRNKLIYDASVDGDAWHLVKMVQLKSIEFSLNTSDSIKLIKLIWKTIIVSLEWDFLLPILFLLYIVVLLPVTVNNLLKKLYIVNKLHWCLFAMYRKKFVCN